MNNEITEKIQGAMKILEECIVLAGRQKGEQGTVANQNAGKVLDFNLNPRAFFKKYVGNLSGPKKAVLVLAYLTKGKETVAKNTDEIKLQWDQVTGLMAGDFMSMYLTRAKENDWVDTPEFGIYTLRPQWTKILHKS